MGSAEDQASSNAMAFVVRTVGERTENLCNELIVRYKNQNEPMFTVRRPTHVDAIQETLELAADQPGGWIVAVDADMLLYPGALNQMRTELNSVHENASVVHFAVSDKFYRMRRWGVTAYRQCAAAEGAIVLSDIRKNPSLKIERALIRKLQEAGRIIDFSKTDVALHDFYQYYSDLYRKAYLNAVRNPAITKRAEKVWKRVATSDPDYIVILKGTHDAVDGSVRLSNSVRDFEPTRLKEIVESLGLEEKSPLTSAVFGKWDLEALVRDEAASLRRNKVDRDFFEKGTLDRVRLRIIRCFDLVRSGDRRS